MRRPVYVLYIWPVWRVLIFVCVGATTSRCLAGWANNTYPPLFSPILLLLDTPIPLILSPPHTHTILYTDSIFPTLYLVLILVTILYGKRGRDLCNSMNVQQQMCKDAQGLAVLPIFVEMVR